MKNTLLFLFFFLSFLSFGQVQNHFLLIDKKMASIPSEKTQTTADIAHFINTNFKTETEKIRAIFYWTASNIRYDVASISSLPTQETPQDKITKTLKTHKGVCAEYSLVFNEIANLVGIKSFVIQGYTKQNGKIDILSHAWCASKIDNNWYLFDPTWGAGYVFNNKFNAKFNNTYFKLSPTQMISSHMPFDYLWQFLPFPISHQEFIEGKSTSNKIKYDFNAEIVKYESLTNMDQYFESSQRIEKNGIKNQLILDAYTYAKKAWSIERDNTTNNKYNQVVNDYNEAINELNDFIYYRNNKFKPNLTDEEIKSKIQIPNEKLKKCQDAIFKISATNKEIATNINNLRAQIAEALVQSETHLQFVNKYLTKSTLVRKTMFTKFSWK
jgi:transglutaminase/protease-like cytokinesis protein 3